MLKLLTKYGALYLGFQKYRKNLAVIFVSTISMVITLFVYSDVVEFLKNKSLTDYLLHALIAKWLIILIGLAVIAFTLKPRKEVSVKNLKPTKSISEPKSEIEIEILNKKELKSHADLVIEEAKKKKKLD